MDERETKASPAGPEQSELEAPPRLLTLLIVQSLLMMALSLFFRGPSELWAEMQWRHSFLYWVPLLTLALMSCSAVVILCFRRLYDAVIDMFELLSGLQAGSRWSKYGRFFLLACLSGLSEELFFRGVIQHYWGVIPASLLFGLVHIPAPQFWPYGLWAACMGLGFGGVYLWQDSLLLCVLIHGLNNFLALCLWPWAQGFYSRRFQA